MGNTAFIQVIVGILVCSAVIILYFILFNKNKTMSKYTNKESELTSIEALAQDDLRADKDLSGDSLIAVLTAAVMASMQSNPDIKIRVTSFRRIPQTSPVWNTIGRRERIENKL